MRWSWRKPWLWRWRKPGRHELGAAVTSIPSSAASVVEPTQPAALQVSQLSVVSLGFRDGSTAALDPASAPAQALQQLARALISTD